MPLASDRSHCAAAAPIPAPPNSGSCMLLAASAACAAKTGEGEDLPKDAKLRIGECVGEGSASAHSGRPTGTCSGATVS